MEYFGSSPTVNQNMRQSIFWSTDQLSLLGRDRMRQVSFQRAERSQNTTNSWIPREEIIWMEWIWANTVEYLAVQAQTNEG